MSSSARTTLSSSTATAGLTIKSRTRPRLTDFTLVYAYGTLMRRLTLLLLALSFAVVAAVAHGTPLVHGVPYANAAEAPGDRDGDGTPDASDQCPDTPGGFNGCPAPPDRDADNFP